MTKTIPNFNCPYHDRLGVNNDVSGPGGDSGDTIHVKQINTLRIFDADTVSSSADDGKIVLWKNSLDAKMKGLSV